MHAGVEFVGRDDSNPPVTSYTKSPSDPLGGRRRKGSQNDLLVTHTHSERERERDCAENTKKKNVVDEGAGEIF